jgi:hypothetical protein
MNSAPASTLVPARGSRGTGAALGTVLLAWAACSTVVQAQSVLMQPPPVDVTPPALREFRASQSGEPLPEGEEVSRDLSRWMPPWQAGPLTLRPHFDASYSYATGLLTSGGEPGSTTTFQLAPGLLFQLGTHWTLDYTPNLVWFSNNNFQNQVDQNLALNGWGAYEDWIFSLSLGLSSSSEAQVQTGGTQTQQTSASTALGASCRLNSKVSVDLGLSQTYQSAQDNQSIQGLQTYWQWSTMDWLNYQFWPRFNAGIGLGFSYVDVSSGSDMTSEQLQGRIVWRVTDKTSVNLHGGLNDLQSLTGGVPPLLSPVYGLSVTTRIGARTTLSLNADQTVSPSYFENQVTETSGVGLRLSQALAKKLSLSLGGDYSIANYSSTASNVSANSAYNYASFTARLTYAIIKRGSISASYQFSDNVSNQPGLSFTSNQIGFELAYNF